MLSCPGAGEGAGLAQPVLGGVLAAAGHSAAGGGAAGGSPQDRDTARPLHPHDGAHHLHLLHHRQVAPPRNIVETFSHRLSSQPFAGTPTTRTAPSSGRARPTSCQPGGGILLNF